MRLILGLDCCMELHVKRSHGREEAKVCPYCGIEKISLTDHILREHQESSK
jgi:hypothetical protein